MKNDISPNFHKCHVIGSLEVKKQKPVTTDFKAFLEELLHEKFNLIPTDRTQAAICAIVEVADFKPNCL